MTYIDHRDPPEPGVNTQAVTHSWPRFTETRLRWLYGDGHSIERRPATTDDLTAWRSLGKGRAAA